MLYSLFRWFPSSDFIFLISLLCMSLWPYVFHILKKNLTYYLFKLFYSLIFILVHIFSESVIYIFSTNHIPIYIFIFCVFQDFIMIIPFWLFSGSPVLSSVRFNWLSNMFTEFLFIQFHNFDLLFHKFQFSINFLKLLYPWKY